MTDHERAAMDAAIREAHSPDTPGYYYSKVCRRIWEAARKYEPPAMCKVKGRNGTLDCDLLEHDTGDHRHNIGDGFYIGWPRT